MKNIDEMTARLSHLFNQIESDQIDLKKAAELNNTTGKILKAYQLQLALHALRGEAPNIPFLMAESVVPQPTRISAEQAAIGADRAVQSAKKHA